ncbi:hypothetical protein [Streptomyces monomycini]|uniref:hypothetical protein n=1 Tax=Streptomyces monomycini TaxID=371720 RepID=UPI0004AB996B|nr:hypothetical protein [Streptomyces monomycini]
MTGGTLTVSGTDVTYTCSAGHTSQDWRLDASHVLRAHREQANGLKRHPDDLEVQPGVEEMRRNNWDHL